MHIPVSNQQENAIVDGCEGKSDPVLSFNFVLVILGKLLYISRLSIISKDVTEELSGTVLDYSSWSMSKDTRKYTPVIANFTGKEILQLSQYCNVLFDIQNGY